MAWHDHLPRLHKHLGEEEQDLIVGCRNHKPMGEMRQDSAYPSPRTNLPPSSSSSSSSIWEIGISSAYRGSTLKSIYRSYEHTPARQA